jgi:hypothetical protein
MQSGKFLAFLLIPLICLSACSLSGVTVGPKKEVLEYEERRMPVKSPLNLEIISDSGNIQLYSWDRQEVKLEINKVIRGTQTKEALKEQLKEYAVNDRIKESEIQIKTYCKGSEKNPADRRIDMRLFIPKRGGNIRCSLDIGTLKFHDDIHGDLRIKTNMANVDINRLEGLIQLEGNLGNVRIEGGKILSGSSILEKMGNISIKAEYEEGGSYCFETELGNIDLKVPSDAPVSFDSIGKVDTNEFPVASYRTRVRMVSGMGTITVKKY